MGDGRRSGTRLRPNTKTGGQDRQAASARRDRFRAPLGCDLFADHRHQDPAARACRSGRRQPGNGNVLATSARSHNAAGRMQRLDHY